MDPLAGSSWSEAGTVAGFVQSPPNQTLLAYAARRLRPGLRVLDIGCGAGRRVALALAPMDGLPIRDASVDLIVAHGIWNLARSGEEFRRAVREAARVAAPSARLFVFTFSRHTLPDTPRRSTASHSYSRSSPGSPRCFSRPIN